VPSVVIQESQLFEGGGELAHLADFTGHVVQGDSVRRSRSTYWWRNKTSVAKRTKDMRAESTTEPTPHRDHDLDQRKPGSGRG